MQVRANGISIEIEDHGGKDDPAILLIMGFGGQLILWPDELVESFVAAGFRVIRFDNRDIGLSHKYDGVKAPHPIWQLLVKRFLKRRRMAPYWLTDMAEDAVGVLDALAIDRAHVVGVSMGGMICQILAADHGNRVRSLIPVMTSTNAPGLPGPGKKVRKILFKAARSRPRTEDEAVAAGVGFFEAISARKDEAAHADIETIVRNSVGRSFYPEGPTRQMAAIIDTGDLRGWTRRIAAPTLVIHGAADPLIPQACGEDVARNIDGARFEAIEGMGHDIPPELLPRLADLVVDHCRANP